MDAKKRNALVTALTELDLGMTYEEVAFNLQLADVVNRLTEDQVTAMIDRAKKIIAVVPQDATREDVSAIRQSFLGLYPRLRPMPTLPSRAQ